MSATQSPVSAFDKEVGARLRQARNRLGWSLHDAERKSGGVHKAGVNGAYERGERQLLVKRLYELAELYGADPFDLLPPREEPSSPQGQLTEAERKAYLLWQVLAAMRGWFPGTPPHPEGDPS